MPTKTAKMNGAELYRDLKNRLPGLKAPKPLAYRRSFLVTG